MNNDQTNVTEIGSRLSLGVSRDSGHEHVSLVGELDMASAGALEREMNQIEDRCGADKLVVDLSDLRYVDSSGLDALVNIADAARTRRFQLELTRGHAGLHKVFELTGLDRVLPFSDEPEGLPGAPALT